MLGLASSSRLPATLSPTLMFVRTKKTSKGSHFVKEQAVRAYKPRVPKPRSPHDIRTPNPNAGASQAHPLEYQPFIPKTTSVALEDSYLRLHHSPPASAPTYTTGVVPTLLQWLGGNSVNLSGEEAARLRYKAKAREVAAEGLAPPREWSEETKAKIVSLREQGMSQGRIIKKCVDTIDQYNASVCSWQAWIPKVPKIRHCSNCSRIAGSKGKEGSSSITQMGPDRIPTKSTARHQREEERVLVVACNAQGCMLMRI